MSIEPAPKLNNNSSEGEKGAKNAAEGVVGRPIRQMLLDEGEDDPGRVSYLRVFDQNGKLELDDVIRRDPDRREEIIDDGIQKGQKL